MTEYRIIWQEFDREERLILRQKFFKSEKTMNIFLRRLTEKPNFHKVYSVSVPEATRERGGSI